MAGSGRMAAEEQADAAAGGDLVILQGLTGASDLNGNSGIAVDYQDPELNKERAFTRSKRYLVVLDGTEPARTVSEKPGNLYPVRVAWRC